MYMGMVQKNVLNYSVILSQNLSVVHAILYLWILFTNRTLKKNVLKSQKLQYTCTSGVRKIVSKGAS